MGRRAGRETRCSGQEGKKEDCAFLKLSEKYLGLLVTNTHYSEDRHGHPASMVQVLSPQGWQTAAPVRSPHFHTHCSLCQLKTALNLFDFLVPFRQPLPVNQSWKVRENPFVILSKSPQGTSVLGIL